MCLEGGTKNCEKQEWMLRNTNSCYCGNHWMLTSLYTGHGVWCMCVCGGIVLRLFPGVYSVYRGSVAQAEIRWLVTVPQ